MKSSEIFRKSEFRKSLALLLLSTTLFLTGCTEEETIMREPQAGESAPETSKNGPSLPNSSQKVGCFSEAEIIHEMNLVLEEMSPALSNISRPFRVEFKNYAESNEKERSKLGFEINSYKEPYLTLRAYGNRCNHGLSRDALKLILCHEIGHVAGGAPFRNFNYSDISFSTESASDFFASAVCFPNLIKNDDNSQFLDLFKANKEITEICQTENSDMEKAICARSLSAALNLSEHFYKFFETPLEDKDPGPSPKLIPSTGVSYKSPKSHLLIHPKPQCRLETFITGTRCRVDESSPVSLTDKPNAETLCQIPADQVTMPSCIDPYSP